MHCYLIGFQLRFSVGCVGELIAYITLWVVFPMSFDHLPIRNPKFGTSDLDWTATFCAQDPNNVSLQKMAMIGNWRGDTDSNWGWDGITSSSNWAICSLSLVWFWIRRGKMCWHGGGDSTRRWVSPNRVAYYPVSGFWAGWHTTITVLNFLKQQPPASKCLFCMKGEDKKMKEKMCGWETARWIKGTGASSLDRHKRTKQTFIPLLQTAWHGITHNDHSPQLLESTNTSH